MCGRFANHVDDMRRWVDLLRQWPLDLVTGYNVAPTQQVPVVIGEGVHAMRWGLVPAWSKEDAPRFATFNARLESVAEKPAFRNAWRNRQNCLVPVLGYYEWIGDGGRKQPYFVHHPDGEPLVMAGLWEQRGEQLSFTVLTEQATAPMAGLHHRMPVMCSLEHAEAWLVGEYRFEPVATTELRVPMAYYPVSPAVNNARNQGPALIEPLEDETPEE